MIKAYKNIKKLKHMEYFKTWIIRILINECNKIYLYRKRNNLSIIEYNNLNKSTNIENEILDEIDFNNLIKNLKDDEKTILTLYYKLNYTTKEISETLKINESTIRSKISRAKGKLYKQLMSKEEYNG